MAKPVVLSNGREWRTQSAAEAHFRELRDRYELKVPIDDPQDHDDLAALLERYDTAIVEGVSKIGAGIHHFEVRMNYIPGRGSTRGFWVVRTDGSETDFSFIAAVKGTPKPEAQSFADACRSAVADDLQRAKTSFFAEHGDASGRVPCDITGELISPEDAHLDHAYPKFSHLVITFRAARGWHEGVPAGIVSQSQDRQTITTFVDEATAQAFRDFHRRAADLRIIKKGKNLEMAAAGRRPKIRRPVKL